MKLLIASDIHGSALATRKLIGAFYDEKCDYMLLLGDILYHGPRNALPGEYDCAETAKQLNAIKEKIWCVRGNCDAEVDQMVLEFPIQAEYMQIPIDGKVIFATHGDHIGPDCPPPLGSCDILMCGHFHIPEIRRIADGLIYANPGSTSIPKGGSKASYMTFDGKTLVQKYLDDGTVFNTFEFR